MSWARRAGTDKNSATRSIAANFTNPNHTNPSLANTDYSRNFKRVGEDKVIAGTTTFDARLIPALGLTTGQSQVQQRCPRVHIPRVFVFTPQKGSDLNTQHKPSLCAECLDAALSTGHICAQE